MRATHVERASIPGTCTHEAEPKCGVCRAQVNSLLIDWLAATSEAGLQAEIVRLLQMTGAYSITGKPAHVSAGRWTFSASVVLSASVDFDGIWSCLLSPLPAVQCSIASYNVGLARYEHKNTGQ